VDEKDLPNAIALNSIQFNLARVLGPVLFAATLATFLKWGYNEPQAMNAAFFLNALSFRIVNGTLMSLFVHLANLRRLRLFFDRLSCQPDFMTILHAILDSP
jgi:hypothetical protein